MTEAALAGRIAVVTGASGRLGPLWVATLADAGATVVGLDLEPAADGRAERVITADVTDADAVRKAHEEIASELGRVEILVNNAGIDRPPSADGGNLEIEDIPLADFRRTLDVNLTGSFNATQVVGSAMRDGGSGTIVNIGSLYAGIAPDPTLYEHMAVDPEPPFLKPPAYGASKAGLINLTRYFARLWGPAGVRVNALSPGGVRGDQDPEFLRKFCARVPLGRMAEYSDLAGPMLFLASDASLYITGQELQVDGGFTA